ncbi:hypothetical protein X975_16822, partial [Stegodyphus mimosarum]
MIIWRKMVGIPNFDFELGRHLEFCFVPREERHFLHHQHFALDFQIIERENETPIKIA